MNTNYYFLITLICFSCKQSDTEKNQLNWTKPVIKGHWKLQDVEIVNEVPFLNLRASESDPMNSVSEDSPWDYYTKHDLVFEKDRMYMVDYPIQAFTPVHYFLDTGYMHVGPKDDIYTYPAELVNDTLYFYRPLSSEPGYFKETYVRTSFNDSTLTIMKKHGVNYPELAGTWMLVREEDYDHGTHYKLNFPYTLPDSIVFTREQMIAALHAKTTYMMSTDGIKREYSFVYRESKIYFKPGAWYKNDDEPLIYFNKRHIE